MGVDVVVVEPNPTVRRVFRQVFERSALEVLEVPSLDALRSLSSRGVQDPDVVVFVDVSDRSSAAAPTLLRELPEWLRASARLVLSHVNADVLEVTPAGRSSWLVRPFKPLHIYELCRSLCPAVVSGRVALDIPEAVQRAESRVSEANARAWETVTAAIMRAAASVARAWTAVG